MHTERSVCFIMSDTREYIIDQAYGLFLSRSYEAVSISEISKAIGLTKGALYHHFTSKEELFKAVIDKYLVLDELISPGIETTLSELIRNTVEKARKIVHVMLGEQPAFIPISYMALFVDAFRHYKGFADEKEKILSKEIDKVKLVMDNAIITGEIRGDIDTTIMAINYFSLSTGMIQNLMHNNSPKLAIDSLRDQLAELYKLLKKE